MPHVKSAETTDIHAQHDPYVAFRRRVEKMQTRKDRQNQETQYINMLKLQRDFEKVRSLMIMVKKREETKKDVLRSDAEITKLRHELKDWDGTVMKKFMPWLQPPRPIVVPPVRASQQLPPRRAMACTSCHVLWFAPHRLAPEPADQCSRSSPS